MIFSRAWFALMRRNVIYRRRNWIGTLLELALPMFFVWVLVAIKDAAENSGTFKPKEISAVIPGSKNLTFIPLTFRDYLTAMQAERRCVSDPTAQPEFDHPFRISGISKSGYGYNWQVPLVKCDSFKCEYDGQDAKPFCEYGSIGVAPSSRDDLGGAVRALDFRDWLYQSYPLLEQANGTQGSLPFQHEFVQVFDSSDDMDRYVTSGEYGRRPDRPKIVMGLVWQGNDTKNYRFRLRQNSTNYNSPEEESRLTHTTPDTKRLLKSYARNDFEVCLPQPGAPRLGFLESSCTGQYMYNGVLTFQRLVGDYILDSTGARAKGYAVAEAGVQFVQFPTKPYILSGFYKTIEDTGPLMVMLGLLYPVANMIGYIVREKELHQKELMKMMSVTESDIGWSWFVTFLLSDIISIVATTAMSTKLYVNSEVVYLSVFWLLTFLAATVFACTVATLSSKSIRGILIGLLVFFLGIFLTIAIPIDYREDDGTWIGIISLHPVAAFSYGLQEIGRLEDQGTGLQSYTIDFTENPSGFTFTTAIKNLVVSCVFWGIMTFYLNRVIKPDYGQALPLWFPFQLSYWAPSSARAPQEPTPGASCRDDCNEGIPLEPVEDSLKRQEKEGKSIELKGLRKVFDETVAVDGLSLSMYSGQVTALLGPNGAGKTTAINLITGAMAPTDGYATVAGLDIRTQLPRIRKDIGICMQTDVIFPKMTVREHVQFYSRLKGLYSKFSRREAEAHVDEAIQDVALSDKRNTLAKNLSGGMKRKLSVAIAFCGGSKVVLLDEPTSGQDPFARRFTWNIIRQYRQNRCIILTTHSMDEADVLGDRIAIMAQGQLQCAGSSLFLKKTYGVGYHLTIEKQKWDGMHTLPPPYAGSCDSLDAALVDEHSNTAGDDSRPQLQSKAAAAAAAEGIPNVPVTSADQILTSPGVGSMAEERGVGKAKIDIGGKVSVAGTVDYGNESTPAINAADNVSSDEEVDLRTDKDDRRDSSDVREEESCGDIHTVPTEASEQSLQSIVTSAVEDATLLSNAGSEMTFQLPMESSAEFSSMFEALDLEVEHGLICSYGISITTLDEVFLKVARGETSNKMSFSSSRQKTNEPSQQGTIGDQGGRARSQMDLDRDTLFMRHLGALFKKRAAFFRRDKKAWLCTSILPSLFVCAGFLVFKFAAPDRNLDPLTLDLGVYNPKAPEPRNPIVFNDPDSSFVCQPGNCAYHSPVVAEESTDEVYFYCGYQARFLDRTKIAYLSNASSLPSNLLVDLYFASLLNASSFPQDLFTYLLNSSSLQSNLIDIFLPYNCTISESRDIVERMTDKDDGAWPQPVQAGNIVDASYDLLSTENLYAATQYGAIYFTHDGQSTMDDGSSYDTSVIATCRSLPVNYTSVEDCEEFANLGYVVQYNYTALHVAPLYQALADEALVREANDDQDYNIQVTIAPLPFTKLEQSFGKAEDGFAAWFLVVLSFPFISGSFASFIVKERQSKAKHLQTVSGVKPTAYWLSAFIFDVFNYQLPLWIVVMLMFAFDVDVLTTTERGVFPGILTVLVLYGFASAGFAYCVTFAFNSPSLCNMFLVIFGFLIGMGGPMTVLILTLLGMDPADEKENLLNAAEIVTWCLRFFPSFGLGKALFNAINIDLFLYLESDTNGTAWSEPILLYEVVFLAWQSVFFVWLAVQLDIWSSNPRAVSIWRKFLSLVTLRCLWGHGDRSSFQLTIALPDDDDVVREESRVLTGRASDDLVVTSQLTKVYDTGKVAVNNVSLGIPTGECFGLLGINGAGKTTLMACMTAEFPPTSGDATLAGFSVTREPQKTRRRIGYCPQYDAHFSNLTGREHLELYANLKGVPKEFVSEAVTAKLEEVGLSETDSNRLSSQYSGGMKRRLSLACATIGQPQIVLLDECSTGVDPVARREIWKLISDMVTRDDIPKEERTSVILSTHSMEESQSLCSRMGIMANGRLRCLGSAQHLKSKFGKGYQIELKVRLVDKHDDDYMVNRATLAGTKQLGRVDDEAAMSSDDEFYFDLPETVAALQTLTNDNSLSDTIRAEDAIGYNVWKDATSTVGVTADTLAAFATGELRMRQLQFFMGNNFKNCVLRERQDTKARFEVSSEGVRISSIFATIEDNKESLRCSDYGVSQTSLEQVFNLHAAEAEALKVGHVDR